MQTGVIGQSISTFAGFQRRNSGRQTQVLVGWWLIQRDIVEVRLACLPSSWSSRLALSKMTLQIDIRALFQLSTAR